MCAVLDAEVPGDHHALDLIRALADLQDLLVPVEARDRVLVHVPVAAVDLEGPIHGAVRELAGVELRLRRCQREVAALILAPGGLVDKIPDVLELSGHIRELELHRLEPRDRLAELPPLLRVSEGEVVGTLREPDAHRGDRDPPAVEDLEELLEALAPRAEEVPLGDRYVLEGELARVRCA